MKKRKYETRVLDVTGQAGNSNYKWDLRYGALKPGKRLTAWNSIYYEYRRNRSDKNPKTKI